MVTSCIFCTLLVVSLKQSHSVSLNCSTLTTLWVGCFGYVPKVSVATSCRVRVMVRCYLGYLVFPLPLGCLPLHFHCSVENKSITCLTDFNLILPSISLLHSCTCSRNIRPGKCSWHTGHGKFKLSGSSVCCTNSRVMEWLWLYKNFQPASTVFKGLPLSEACPDGTGVAISESPLPCCLPLSCIVSVRRTTDFQCNIYMQDNVKVLITTIYLPHWHSPGAEAAAWILV